MGWKDRKTMMIRIFYEKDEFWAWNLKKTEVMDGEGCDEGDDELVWVR